MKWNLYNRVNRVKLIESSGGNTKRAVGSPVRKRLQTLQAVVRDENDNPLQLWQILQRIGEKKATA
jgi:hypothetical protein